MSLLERAALARREAQRPGLTEAERAAWIASANAWEAFSHAKRVPSPRAQSLQARHSVARALEGVVAEYPESWVGKPDPNPFNAPVYENERAPALSGIPF
jgi:hypothetical protein